jgi:hypothetical protein
MQIFLILHVVINVLIEFNKLDQLIKNDMVDIFTIGAFF